MLISCGKETRLGKRNNQKESRLRRGTEMTTVTERWEYQSAIRINHQLVSIIGLPVRACVPGAVWNQRHIARTANNCLHADSYLSWMFPLLLCCKGIGSYDSGLGPKSRCMHHPGKLWFIIAGSKMYSRWAALFLARAIRWLIMRTAP